MAFLAFVNGRPERALTRGVIGTCLDPRCAGEMIAKPGGGIVRPHWAHRHLTDCAMDGNEETGWHLTWRSLFVLHGCETEVTYEHHRADIVTPDGRVVEFQTTWLRYETITSRESAYGNMAWVYRVVDEQTDLDIDSVVDLNGLTEFVWYTPRRSMLAHTRPVYWHRSDNAIWAIRTLFRTNDTTEDGAAVWRGVAQLIDDNWDHFAETISAGGPFADPPSFQGFDSLELKRSYNAAMRLGPSDDDYLDMDIIDCQFHRPRPVASRSEPFLINAADTETMVHIERFRRDCPACRVCGQPMVAGQRGTHYMCRAA